MEKILVELKELLLDAILIVSGSKGGGDGVDHHWRVVIDGSLEGNPFVESMCALHKVILM